jgi:hypothetical protein
MNGFPVQADTAIIAAAVAFGTSLIIALVALKRAVNVQPEYAAENVAHALLMDHKLPYRTFRVLKYHLSGFTDDELRKILVRAGGIRLDAGGQEVWGLLARNRKYLGIDEIKEFPTPEVAFDCVGQQQGQSQEVKEEAERDLSQNSSEPFERVRAEMMKLSALQCVRSAGQK